MIEEKRPICVFGIMDNPNGQTIADEMNRWLKRYYNVVEVWHDGSRFELPALEMAQRVCLEHNEPVLYIHTRGAVNMWKTTIPTRRMWEWEFGRQWRKYYDVCNRPEPVVACPFVDYDRETRYNGFFANPAAWSRIKLEPTTDRMVYERLWKNDKQTRVIGMLIDGCAPIDVIRDYLALNY